MTKKTLVAILILTLATVCVGAVPAGFASHRHDESFTEYWQRRNRNSISPRKSEIFYQRGVEFFEEGDYRRAANSFQRSVFHLYYNADALYMLALTHQTRGKLNRALRYYGRAVYFDEDFTDAYFHMGEVYLLLDKPRRAAESRQALEELDTAKASVRAEELQELIEEHRSTN